MILFPMMREREPEPLQRNYRVNLDRQTSSTAKQCVLLGGRRTIKAAGIPQRSNVTIVQSVEAIGPKSHSNASISARALLGRIPKERQPSLLLTSAGQKVVISFSWDSSRFHSGREAFFRVDGLIDKSVLVP
jgi:hypothetical protein